MAMKWICKRCGEKASDGLSDDPELAKNAKPIDYHGVCPLCGGSLKAYKEKKKE